jgi:hypothetical protein
MKGRKHTNEIGEILKANLWEYEKQYRLNYKQRQVVNNIMTCRTRAQGGHILVCGECGETAVVYNPCKDRHCPNCGAFEKAQWLEEQKVWMLPIGYYHVVFTIDHGLNEIVWWNQKQMYGLLFRVVAKLLQAYGKAYLGGEVGFTMVLHTWGQVMQAHPHLHVIYTGGALEQTERGAYGWKSSGETFLFPVVKLSADFRAAYCKGARKLQRKGKLVEKKRVGPELVDLEIEKRLEAAESQAWEVYIQKPRDGTENLVAYLGKYVFRTAMSNHRIVSSGQGEVEFTYYDNRDGGQQKVMKLSAVEFIRRLLQHVLPPRFHRVRHYGLHHSSQRQKLEIARSLLGLSAELPEIKKLSMVAWVQEVLELETDPRLCPQCGKGLLESIRKIGPIKEWQLRLVPVLGKLYQWGWLT